MPGARNLIIAFTNVWPYLQLFILRFSFYWNLHMGTTLSPLFGT
jgi:hypothetical protein